MGGVFSQAEGYTDVLALLPGYLFHAVCMVGGMACFQRAAVAKEVRQPA